MKYNILKACNRLFCGVDNYPFHDVIYYYLYIDKQKNSNWISISGGSTPYTAWMITVDVDIINQSFIPRSDLSRGNIINVKVDNLNTLLDLDRGCLVKRNKVVSSYSTKGRQQINDIIELISYRKHVINYIAASKELDSYKEQSYLHQLRVINSLQASLQINE
jgi:hypothetical protein